MAELLGGRRQGHPIGGGGEIPVFTIHEVTVLTPEEMLSEMREFYISRGQWRSLGKLDEAVAKNGNPYVKRALKFSEGAA